LEHSYDNLIVLPAGTDLSEVYSELCSFLLMHDQAFQNAESLLQSLAKAEGLNDIVNIGYRMLENPLIISDKGWKALAMTGDVDIPDDTGWNEFKSMGALSFETVSADIESKLTDRIEQSRRRFAGRTRICGIQGFSEKSRSVQGRWQPFPSLNTTGLLAREITCCFPCSAAPFPRKCRKTSCT
jgi:hypothetical protein